MSSILHKRSHMIPKRWALGGKSYIRRSPDLKEEGIAPATPGSFLPALMLGSESSMCGLCLSDHEMKTVSGQWLILGSLHLASH